MDPFKPRASNGEEFFVQNHWVAFLKSKGWHVERLVGNAYQRGIPDLFIGHPDYGTRWIDIKVFGRYSFTKAQKKIWPVWEEYGIGIWIMGAEWRGDCTKEYLLEQYNRVLFNPPNWRDYWRSSWDKEIDIDKLLDEIE
jgi:hypothetical protein